MKNATGLPKVGDVIDAKYIVLRQLGEGGMGIVYEVEHERLGQKFAIKMLQPKVLEIEEYVTRFEREARAAAQLRSRHTARVVDVAETPEGVPYMVMDLLEGCDLAEELALRGRLPVGDAVDFVLQACRAMTEAHDKGIVHRDLKPSNLYLAREGDERVVKVLDFGISKVNVEGQLSVTTTTGSLGTPLYMSPEQIRAPRDVDARTDLWSLGVILFQLLDGHPPFLGMSAASVGASIVADPPRDLSLTRPDVPEDLARVIARTLEKDPANRYASARELAMALAPFVASETLGAAAAHAAARAPGPSTPTVAPTPAVVRTPAAAATPSLVSADTVVSTPSIAAHVDPIAATSAAWSGRPEARPVRASRVAIALAAVAVLATGGVLLLRGRTPASANAPTPASSAPAVTAAAPAVDAPPQSSQASAVAAVASAPVAAQPEPAPSATTRDATKPRAPPTLPNPPAASKPKPATPPPGPADNPVRL